MAILPVRYTSAVELPLIKNTQQSEEMTQEEDSMSISEQDEFDLLKENYAISLERAYADFAELDGNIDYAYTNLKEFTKKNPEFAKKLPEKKKVDNCLGTQCCIIC
jgi:hypothetical protein